MELGLQKIDLSFRPSLELILNFSLLGVEEVVRALFVDGLILLVSINSEIVADELMSRNIEREAIYAAYLDELEVWKPGCFQWVLFFCRLTVHWDILLRVREIRGES